MTTHMHASFYTATLNTAIDPEEWLLPARSFAAAETVKIPYGCTLSFGQFIWLELQNFFEGENGYTFVFHYNSQEWYLDSTHFGHDYLCERFIGVINNYLKSQQDPYL